MSLKAPTSSTGLAHVLKSVQHPDSPEVFRNSVDPSWVGLAHVLKANPYHDERGRFSTKDSANFVSVGGVFDKTIARLRKEVAASEKALASRNFPVIDQTDKGLNLADREYFNATQDEWDSLSKAEVRAVKNYTSSSYSSMNRQVAGDKTYLNNTNEEERIYMAGSISSLDSALNKSSLPENTTLFRAVNVGRLSGAGSFGRNSTVDELKQLIGKKFIDPSFGSSSTDLDTAGDFSTSKRPILAIKAPKGTTGLWVGDNHADYDNRRSSTGGEHEFILARNRAYEITGVSKKKDKNGKEHTVLEVSMLLHDSKVEPYEYID